MTKCMTSKISRWLIVFSAIIALVGYSCSSIVLGDSQKVTAAETRIDHTIVIGAVQTVVAATVKPILTPTDAADQPEFNCLPKTERVQAQVVKVVDGDTIQVTIQGKSYKVRYIGIDTPETVKPNAPVGPFGPEASAKNKELVAGKTVTLVKDVSEVDRYDRLLRYVIVDNQFINYVLVAEGYANASTYPPDVACSETFRQAAAAAQQSGVGLWDLQPTAVQTAQPTPTLAAGSGSCPQGCTEQSVGCSIKGNINAKGQKIYHSPGTTSYEKTKIDPDKGERWFCTPEEAKANGWRAPLN